MQLQDYRFSDYRLAAYVVLGAVIAGGVAFGLDRLTAPATKIEANGAPPAAVAAAAVAAAGNVRQIPIARSSAADLGDPENKLTPVYPAAPGKDLPVKDTPVIEAAKPVTSPVTSPAATTGSASPSAPVAAAPAPAQAAAPSQTAVNACNVAACAATYRSFRESDCSYQPFEGPRRLCEGTPDANGQLASQPVQQQSPQAQRAPVARSRYDDELRDAERMVRRLPPPGVYGEDDRRGVIVMEAPEQRYELRRNWVSEPLD
jgi:hypothetical protein